jgi:hypothetical protein
MKSQISDASKLSELLKLAGREQIQEETITDALSLFHRCNAFYQIFLKLQKVVFTTSAFGQASLQAASSVSPLYEPNNTN